VYSNFCSLLGFRALQYIEKNVSNGTLGDTDSTLTMPRPRNAKARGSVHSRCQPFVSCSASQDRLSNPVLGPT